MPSCICGIIASSNIKYNLNIIALLYTFKSTKQEENEKHNYILCVTINDCMCACLYKNMK